ncbi:MAG: DUF2894 domain-containing protein [Burkholderiaceae bacterium]|nr:DUF2894 domain-containing protein [Burkholderiaceae bacterium]
MTQPTLQSLKAQGAHERDPLRFHYLEALERKIPTQPPAVQRLLACKLQAEIDAWAGIERTAAESQNGTTQRPTQSPLSPITQLNRDLAARINSDADLVQPQGPGTFAELRSVRHFSQVWSKIASDAAVQHLLSTGPDNAGPLNPHRLMQRSLHLMRTLSPDYLRHFWSHMDSLLWLEQMHASTASPAANSTTRPTTKPVRKARAK